MNIKPESETSLYFQFRFAEQAAPISLSDYTIIGRRYAYLRLE